MYRTQVREGEHQLPTDEWSDPVESPTAKDAAIEAISRYSASSGYLADPSRTNSETVTAFVAEDSPLGFNKFTVVIASMNKLSPSLAEKVVDGSRQDLNSLLSDSQVEKLFCSIANLGAFVEAVTVDSYQEGFKKVLCDNFIGDACVAAFGSAIYRPKTVRDARLLLQAGLGIYQKKVDRSLE